MSIKIKEGFVLREVGPIHMAVPFGALTKEISGMVALSETGYYLWQQIEKGVDTEPALVKALLAEYDVDEETGGKHGNHDIHDGKRHKVTTELEPAVLCTPGASD